MAHDDAKNGAGSNAEGKRRVRVTRRLGDAELRAGGASVFLGDMTRVAGVEIVEGDERRRADVFEG